MDCIDARITDQLMANCRNITLVNGYNTNVATVEELRSILQIDTDKFPYCLLIPNELDPQSEFAFRDDVLSYMIWYLDGKSDELEGEQPFTRRLRNVAADFIKEIRKDPSLNGLAQNIRITRHNFGCLMTDTICELGVYMFVEVERIINPDNPYQLA